jgi:hypothetical protein
MFQYRLFDTAAGAVFPAGNPTQRIRVSGVPWHNLRHYNGTHTNHPAQSSHNVDQD